MFIPSHGTGDACQRLMSLYEKMEVQHIGAFFRDYPLETASHLQLHQLYLKDFIVSVIQSHNMEEAKVIIYMHLYEVWCNGLLFSFLIAFLCSGFGNNHGASV